MDLGWREPGGSLAMHTALSSLLALALLGGVVRIAELPPADAAPRALPQSRELKVLVERYLGADAAGRRSLRAQADRDWPSLPAPSVPALRKELLALARRVGPKLEAGGTHTFLPGEKGKYIATGRPSRVLFLGLHGGGLGSGEAESAAGAMGGGGWGWIYPEVLEKTEHGWTTSGTEEFVVELIDAAKRSGKVDPDRIYITGHSMGGYGAWTLGAHHADVFAGAAAFAGAPSCYYKPGTDPKQGQVEGVVEGVLPNFYALPLEIFQSLDDENVPPHANVFANQALMGWKERFPGGFPYRYTEVSDRQHGPPIEGYRPTLERLAVKPREARPRRFLWQPVRPWKKQLYWVHWEQPEQKALLEVAALADNTLEITTHEGSHDVTGLSVLLGAPLVDLAREVVVRVDGKEAWRGVPVQTLSTLLMTLPRHDALLLFDARVDL